MGNMRMNDFEGRCVTCHRDLDMALTRFPPSGLRLDVVPCPEHPGASVILWLQRDDMHTGYKVSEESGLESTVH